MSNNAEEGSTGRPTRPRAAGLTVAVACIGFFVTVLDSTAVTIALPTIGRQLGGAVSGLQWVVNAYTLAFAALMLSAGAISDRIGASRAFGLGLAVFTLASAACGLASTLTVLILARVVQGSAAAIMLPASLSLVRQAFPDSAARARAISWWTAGGGAAIAAGPVVGGILTSALGWPVIFFINVPAGIIGLLGLIRTPRSASRPAPLDIGGQLASVAVMTAITYTVISAGKSGFGPASIVALVVVVLAGVAFWWIESHAQHPAVPLGLFRSPAVAVCTATGFALNFAFYGIVFVLTLFFQDHRGASPVVAGLMFIPMTALVMGTNLIAGKLTARFGPRPPLLAGQLVQATGLLGLLVIGPVSPTLLILVLLVPLGLGGGTAVPPMTTALLDAVDADRSGLASGILNASRQLGGAIGVAVFGVLVSTSTDFVTGMRTSLIIGAAVLLATAATGLVYLRPATEPTAAP
jgi:MFS transporter, DHA2 family, methylenomycin A resistance protein